MLEPLEHAISDVLIPALLEHPVTETERDLLALPVRMGGLGLVNPVNQSRQEYEDSAPLVKQIVKQAAEPPNDEDVAGAQRRARQEKADSARRDLEDVTKSLPLKTQRAVEFIKEKGDDDDELYSCVDVLTQHKDNINNKYYDN